MDDFGSLIATIESMPFMEFPDGPHLASEQELLHVEGLISATLPPDYRWFAKSIGQLMTPSEWTLQAEGTEELDITIIFGGAIRGDQAHPYSLAHCVRQYGKLLERSELFIGRDSFANLYVLNASTNRYRFVALDGHRSVDLGATGFEEFLNLIKPQLPYD